MLTINDLKSGSLVIIDGSPYQILELSHLHMGRGGSSIQTKIRNLKTGQVFSRNFKPSDMFEEANIEKRPLTFLYQHRDQFVFEDPANKKNRFSLNESVIGENKKWLKPNSSLTGVFLEGEPLNLTLPIKMDFKVTEAPPGIQGNRSQAGTKAVTIETGTVVQTPLFINTGDAIRVNTETGEYVERVSKGL